MNILQNLVLKCFGNMPATCKRKRSFDVSEVFKNVPSERALRKKRACKNHQYRVTDVLLTNTAMFTN